MAQTGEISVDRFTVNQSAVLNSFQSPQYLYGNVELSFGQEVTLIEATVRIQDGYGKPIQGAGVSKTWASAPADKELQFDYTYYNPSAVQEFKPVLVITARGPGGKHLQQTFQPTGE